MTLLVPLGEKFWEVLEPSFKKVLTSLVIGLSTTYLTNLLYREIVEMSRLEKREKTWYTEGE